MIDLDPEGIPFSAVVETAQCVHEILEKYGINSYCKTPPVPGACIFLFLPAQNTNTIPSRLFAEFIARETNAQLPGISSVIRTKNPKKEKSIRGFFTEQPGANHCSTLFCQPQTWCYCVSTPLDWKEVNEKLDMKEFHIGNTVSRLKKKGDLWANIYKDKNDPTSEWLKNQGKMNKIFHKGRTDEGTFVEFIPHHPSGILWLQQLQCKLKRMPARLLLTKNKAYARKNYFIST